VNCENRQSGSNAESDQILYSDEAEKTWVWRTEESELWFDEGTVVNLRIEAEKWVDLAAKGPNMNGEAELEQQRPVPYSIEASMAEAGLGSVEWW